MTFTRSSESPSWAQRGLTTAVRLYRLLLSPWLGSACRFEPTCSAYALQALDEHGAAGGTYLTARRLMRCHPWCAGGIDPVPSRAGRPPSPDHFPTEADDTPRTSAAVLTEKIPS